MLAPAGGSYLLTLWLCCQCMAVLVMNHTFSIRTVGRTCVYVVRQPAGGCSAWFSTVSAQVFVQLVLYNAFYPRDAMLARVIVIATCLSVRLSVRPSVTRRYCVKTKKASGMISSPSGNPKTLVFRHQISSPNSNGFHPDGGLKQGSVGKIQRFFSFKRQYLVNRSRYGQSYY